MKRVLGNDIRKKMWTKSWDKKVHESFFGGWGPGCFKAGGGERGAGPPTHVLVIAGNSSARLSYQTLSHVQKSKQMKSLKMVKRVVKGPLSPNLRKETVQR